MFSEELYMQCHGFPIPTETHSLESLKFAQEFAFKDEDVLAVTYPKSGRCFYERLKFV